MPEQILFIETAAHFVDQIRLEDTRVGKLYRLVLTIVLRQSKTCEWGHYRTCRARVCRRVVAGIHVIFVAEVMVNSQRTSIQGIAPGNLRLIARNPARSAIDRRSQADVRKVL